MNVPPDAGSFVELAGSGLYWRFHCRHPWDLTISATYSGKGLTGFRVSPGEAWVTRERPSSQRCLVRMIQELGQDRSVAQLRVLCREEQGHRAFLCQLPERF